MSPVAFLFARTADDALASLVKQLDKVVADNGDAKMAAVVNFLDMEQDAVAKFAEDNEIKHVALVVTDKENADRFKINEAADLTVMHYTGKKVKANYAVAKGKLDAETSKAIIESTSMILPMKSGLQVGDKVKSYQSTKVAGAEDGIEVGESLCYT